jgi:hypothetical protein
MGKGKKSTVGGIVFNTLNELDTYAKKLRDNLPLNIHITDEHSTFPFITDLVKRHPDYERKKGTGIKAFIKGVNNDNKMMYRKIIHNNTELSTHILYHIIDFLQALLHCETSPTIIMKGYYCN